MLVMIGAWIAMQNGELLDWGGVAKSMTTPFPDAPLVLGPVSVSWLRLFVLAAAAMLIVGTYLLINRTKLGSAMRATFQDRDTAALMGVNIDLHPHRRPSRSARALPRRPARCWGRCSSSTRRWATSPRSRPSRS